jgi:GntR family transcriptional regulator of arabinose operon
VSRYNDIAHAIKSQITEGQFKSGQRIPTEDSLSKTFSASRQTIRQALGILKHEGKIYQVQGSGTYVSDQYESSTRKTRSSRQNIAIICTYISDYIFPTIMRGIERELTDQGYNLNLVATGNRVARERRILLQIIADNEIDAIIVEGTKTGFPNPNISPYQKIMEMNIPIVFLHCSYPELTNSVVVGMDDYAGGKFASRKLIASGCRKIAGVFKSDDTQGLLRYKGFFDGILESGLGLECAEIRWFTTEDIEVRGNRLGCEQLSSIVGTGIDGIVCYNDQITTAFIRDARDYGIQLSHIISFDNSTLCSSALYPYVSLGHQKEKLGSIAAQKIKNMLKGQKETSVFMDWDTKSI